MAVRKKTATGSKVDPTRGLPPLNLNAAGIDVGSAEHWVAVPPGRDTETVRCFHSFTADVHCLADWLQACGIETIAMESTGVYWIGLFQVLEARGFTVHVVDARRAKSLPGRKSDVLDGQWVQKPHLWVTRPLLSAYGGDLCTSRILAPAGDLSDRRRHVYSAYAESAD